jgi:hypothetical protein
MLRVEKTFEEEGIEDELNAYNPLVPGGSDFKATMMIEYPNEADRKVALAKLVGYKKPASASGSTARYFFEYLKKK